MASPNAPLVARPRVARPTARHSVQWAVTGALLSVLPLFAIGLPVVAEQLSESAVSAVVAHNLARAAVVDATLTANARADDAVRAAESERLANRAAALASGAPARALEVIERTVAVRDYWITIGPNDSWESIASAFGHSGTTLAALNPGVDLNALAEGQRLLALRYDDRVGSRSVGTPNRGRLLGGIPMPDGDHWVVRDPHLAFGTAEAVSHMVRGLSHVGETLPGGATPMVGDLSRRHGRRLKRHRSHQSGRDADVAYYFHDAARSEAFTPATPATMDIERQWALFSYWIERDVVTYVFIDPRLQRALRRFAESQGIEASEIDRIFGGGRSAGILRYSPGHRDHFHVRFRCADRDDRCRDV